MAQAVIRAMARGRQMKLRSPLTSCCAARFLTGCRPVSVPGLGVGDSCPIGFNAMGESRAVTIFAFSRYCHNSPPEKQNLLHSAYEQGPLPAPLTVLNVLTGILETAFSKAKACQLPGWEIFSTFRNPLLALSPADTYPAKAREVFCFLLHSEEGTNQRAETD